MEIQSFTTPMTRSSMFWATGWYSGLFSISTMEYVAMSGNPPPVSPLWPRPGPGSISLISMMGNSLGGVVSGANRSIPPWYLFDRSTLFRAQMGHRTRSCWGIVRSPIWRRRRLGVRILIV